MIVNIGDVITLGISGIFSIYVSYIVYSDMKKLRNRIEYLESKIK